MRVYSLIIALALGSSVAACATHGQIASTGDGGADNRIAALEGAADTSWPDVSVGATMNQTVIPVYPPANQPTH